MKELCPKGQKQASRAFIKVAAPDYPTACSLHRRQSGDGVLINNEHPKPCDGPTDTHMNGHCAPLSQNQTMFAPFSRAVGRGSSPRYAGLYRLVFQGLCCVNMKVPPPSLFSERTDGLICMRNGHMPHCRLSWYLFVLLLQEHLLGEPVLFNNFMRCAIAARQVKKRSRKGSIVFSISSLKILLI